MRLAFAPLSSQVDNVPAYSKFFEKHLAEESCNAFEELVVDEIVNDIMTNLETPSLAPFIETDLSKLERATGGSQIK